MTHCYDEGALRAFADAALPDDQHAALALHLCACAACQRRLADVQDVAARATTLLNVPAPSVNVHAAFARLHSHQQPTTDNQHHTSQPLYYAAHSKQHESKQKGKFMNTFNTRRWLAGVAALVIAIALLALPPVRAVADQLLQVFRVQNLVFVPVSQERMDQLKQLHFDKDTLFVSKPKIVNSPAAPRSVNNAQEATNIVGFPVAQPAAFPAAPTSTKIVVLDRRVMETQINVEAARQVLKLMQIDDVTLPDALGAKPISADTPPSVASSYTAPKYSVELVQGPSPTIALPDGVDMAQLGKAVLRLLGTDSAQADAMSQQIDWSSTFVVPIPADVNNVREVSVNGAKGMLVRAREQDKGVQVLYWQQGDRYYVLRAHGSISDTDLLAMAASVQ